MTQFLKKVFMHAWLCIIMFQKKDIFYKYLKISKYSIAKKLAIYKTF